MKIVENVRVLCWFMRDRVQFSREQSDLVSESDHLKRKRVVQDLGAILWLLVIQEDIMGQTHPSTEIDVQVLADDQLLTITSPFSKRIDDVFLQQHTWSALWSRGQRRKSWNRHNAELWSQHFFMEYNYEAKDEVIPDLKGTWQQFNRTYITTFIQCSKPSVNWMHTTDLEEKTKAEAAKMWWPEKSKWP